MKQHIKTVKELNVLGRNQEAVDEVVKAAERYELLRTLNPREFKQLYQENIKMGTGFDNLVDNLVKARK